MQMTEAFAAAVTVTVPILALAAGAEARTVRERVRRPDEKWEREFAEYEKEHELDPGKSHAEALKFFIDMPEIPKSFLTQRLAALAGAFAWLVVFVLLAIDELLSLAWLGDGARGADAGLATFSEVTIALALASLIVAPALYLMTPVLFSFDLLPHGLRKAIGRKVTVVSGRDLLRHMAREFETAVAHVTEETKRASQADAGPGPGPGKAGSRPAQDGGPEAIPGARTS